MVLCVENTFSLLRQEWDLFAIEDKWGKRRNEELSLSKAEKFIPFLELRNVLKPLGNSELQSIQESKQVQ